jgi:GTP cyclohydrolase I
MPTLTTLHANELLDEIEADLEDGVPEDPIQPLVHGIVKYLGENPARAGLKATPYRVAKALRELTRGYDQDPGKVLKSALFDVTYDEMVIVKDIEVFSLCEHHMLPFFGKLHLAYIPREKVIGLSKTARMVDIFARRLQIQERLTQQVAETIQNAIDPLGVGVICEAQHLCMMMRGVEKQHSSTITSAMMGAFRNSPKTREEFLSLISHGQRR